jgi:uncharacterized protein YrzB (UPF0473 family)
MKLIPTEIDSTIRLLLVLDRMLSFGTGSLTFKASNSYNSYVISHSNNGSGRVHTSIVNPALETPFKAITHFNGDNLFSASGYNSSIDLFLGHNANTYVFIDKDSNSTSGVLPTLYKDSDDLEKEIFLSEITGDIKDTNKIISSLILSQKDLFESEGVFSLNVDQFNNFNTIEEIWLGLYEEGLKCTRYRYLVKDIMNIKLCTGE